MTKYEWRKIKYEQPASNTPEICPECGGAMFLGRIRPPYEDDYLTPHLGYICLECGGVCSG